MLEYKLIYKTEDILSLFKIFTMTEGHKKVEELLPEVELQIKELQDTLKRYEDTITKKKGE